MTIELVESQYDPSWGESTTVRDFEECSECFALVLAERANDHAAWHAINHTRALRPDEPLVCMEFEPTHLVEGVL